MSHRTVVHHRALWISDLHLGSTSCKAKSLTAFLRQNESEHLYLVGDIFDGWKLKTYFFWTPEQSQVVNTILAKALNGTKVYYVTGNHDAFMRQFVRHEVRLGPIHLVNEVVHTTADGRRLLVLHGDTFDDVVGAFPRLSHAADRAYNGLMWANRQMNLAADWFGWEPSSLSATAKNRVKTAVQFLSGFDQKVLHRCQQEQLHGVVCGHTHHAEMRELHGGILSYNCGDWVESCTALAEDAEGRIRILAPPAAVRPEYVRPSAPQLANAAARTTFRKPYVAPTVARASAPGKTAQLA